MTPGGSPGGQFRRGRWFTAARAGLLRFPRCRSCGAWGWPPTSRCGRCGASSWRLADVRGTGSVRAATTVHRGVAPGFADATPYRVGVIALDGGPHFITRLAEGVGQGDRVRLRWRDTPGDGWPWAEPVRS